jgi:RNA polymerase sigma factor (sigma-70 family)
MRAASIPARAPAVPLRSRRLLALAGDARLVELVRRGNEAAFEVIFERHAPAILAFCRHMLGSREDAEDVVQHTFSAAYRDLQRGGDRDIALKAWLFTIARNRCLSVLRAQREVPIERDALEARSPSVAGLAEQVEERADLRRLVADVRALPDEQRAALLLTELGGLTHVEVARVLEYEASRVKGIVFRARSALIARREARETPCESIREQLANLRGGSLRRSELRLHLRECSGCREYREQVKQQRRALAVALPVVPTLGLKSSVLAAIGIGGGSAGGLTAAAGGLGGATVAKVAVAGVLAGGGVVAGTEIVESERPARVTPPAAQEAERTGLPAGAARPVDGGAPAVVRHAPSARVDRTPRAGRRDQARAGAPPGADKVDRATKPARERTVPGVARGPVDKATKVTPVKRGPPAKPWKAERGAQPAPRGQAKGHAKGAPGPKAGAKQGPRPNGLSKPSGKPNGQSKPSGKPNGGPKTRPKPAPGARGNGQANSTPGAKSNGNHLGLAKPPAAPPAAPKGKAGATEPAAPPAE